MSTDKPLNGHIMNLLNISLKKSASNLIEKCLLLFLLLVSCSPEVPDSPDTPEVPGTQGNLILGPGTFEIGSNGSMIIVPVKSGVEFSVEVLPSGSDWIEISKKQDGFFNLTVNPNDTYKERTGQVKVSGAGQEDVIKITQGYSEGLITTVTSYRISSDGGEIRIPVSTNVKLECEILDAAKDWVDVILLQQTSEFNEVFLVLNIKENAGTEPKTARIKVSGAGKESVITIVQSPILERIVALDYYETGSAGGDLVIPVEDNVDFDIELISGEGWLTVHRTSTQGSETPGVLVRVAPNKAYEGRNGQIRVYDGDKESIITISQSPVCELVTSKPSFSVGNRGGRVEIPVETNIDFQCEVIGCAKSWVKVIDASTKSLERKTVLLSVSENTGHVRAGQVRLYGKGKFSVVTVVQRDADIVEVTVATPGTMADCMRGYNLDTITGLCIKGNLNEKDFEVFKSIKNLHYLDISGTSVTEIPNGAFNNPLLTDILLPDNLLSIGESAFMGCNLSSISLPASVTYVGRNAFYGTCITRFDGESQIISQDRKSLVCISNGELCAVNTLLKAFVIPEGVTSIGNRAFDSCYNLVSVGLPSSVTSIGDAAFYNCRGLTSITIPSSVTSIGNSAFSSCSGLTSITIPWSVTSIGSYAFVDCSGLTSITIPSNVTSIGDYAFYECSGLTSITIPSSVTSIGDSAFYGCSGLASITIPSSVTSIGKNVFQGCTGVLNINCDIPDASFEDYYSAFHGSSFSSIIIGSGVTSIGYYAFYGCRDLTSITIPSSVTSIGGCAFYYCSGLTSITIPSSVTSIGASAFYGCSGLTSITIPSSVTSIGSYAFSDCRGLTSITIPSSVTSIGNSAFEGCTGVLNVNCDIPGATDTEYYPYHRGPFINSSFSSIIIGSGVTSIGDYAFYRCSRLTSIYCKSLTPPSGSLNMFNGVDSNAKIYVPMASVDLYKNANYWKNYTSKIVGYEFNNPLNHN